VRATRWTVPEHHIVIDAEEKVALLYALRTFDHHHAQEQPLIGQFCRELAALLDPEVADD